jgi:hypothetical protein
MPTGTIGLAGATDWPAILQASAFDGVGDTQSNAAGLDLVGDSTHALLFEAADASNIAFRARVGSWNNADPTKWNQRIFVGVDITGDGKPDLILSANGGNSPTLSILNATGTLATSNTSPATTAYANFSSGQVSGGGTSNDGVITATGTNYSLVQVTGTDDPSGNGTTTNTDIGTDGHTDIFVSFALPIAALNAAWHTVQSARSIAVGSQTDYTASTVVQYVVFTSTQNTINGDVAGTSATGSNQSATFLASGEFSAPQTAAAPVTGTSTGTPSTPTATPQTVDLATPTLTGTWGGTNAGSDTLSVTVNGVTYTTVTSPAVQVTATTWSLTLPSLTDGGYTIGVSVSRTGGGTASASGSLTIDTTPPTASIVVADNSLTVGETSLVTITFSEAVSGFTNADLSAANGTLSVGGRQQRWRHHLDRDADAQPCHDRGLERHHARHDRRRGRRRQSRLRHDQLEQLRCHHRKPEHGPHDLEHAHQRDRAAVQRQPGYDHQHRQDHQHQRHLRDLWSRQRVIQLDHQ